MTTNVNLGFVADAGGTVDAITAFYTPTYTVLVDKMLVWFRATGANTSTTPTFSPNGLTARTIVKQGGQPLVAGDIPRAGAVMSLVYDSTNTRWELVNPADNRKYKVYTALLAQTGTNAPAATVLENTLGGTLVWGYVDVGTYSATLAGAFNSAKVVFFLTNNSIPNPATVMSAYVFSSDRFDIQTYIPQVGTENDLLSNSPIEIRVYP